MKATARNTKAGAGDDTATLEPAGPARPTLWASAVFALCTLALVYPAFAGKFLAMPWSDQYIAGFGFRDFGVEALRSGGFAQWNPFLFGGMPFVSAMHGDIFYPTAFLRVLIGTGAGMTWGFASHLFLAGLFTFLFVRQWRLGFYPALVAGIAYMLSGQLAGLASPGHDGKLFVSALFPLTLLMLTHGVRDGRAWAWGGLALTIGLVGLTPHPQLAQYLLLASGSYALYLAFSTHDSDTRLPTAVGIKRLAFALGSVLLGGAITTVQYLPLRNYVDWSPRAGGRDYEYATSFSQPIEEFFINSYLPQFTGLINEYWGRNGIHLHSEYLGAAVLFLAVAAIGARTHHGFRRFWLGVFVVGVLWSLGGYTPFYRLVYAIVPGTTHLRAPSTVYFVYAFAVALFAAFGTRRLLAAQISQRYAFSWIGASAAVAVVMMLGGATALARPVVRSMLERMTTENVDQYIPGFIQQNVEPNLSAVVFGGWRSFFFVLLVALLAWALTDGRLKRSAAGWILAAIVAMDMWSVARNYWQFSPPAAEVYATDPAIDLIRGASQPGRVVAISGNDIFERPAQFPAVFRDPLFDGSGFMAHGVRDLTGYHGNELNRYQQLFGAAADRGYSPMRMLDPNVWRHENVHYLYTTLPDTIMPLLQAQLQLPGAFTRLAGPVRDASGSTVYLYRVPGENPFAWVASGAVRASDDQSLPTVTDARFDPKIAALVDTQSTIRVTDAAALGPSPLTATVGSYAAGRVTIELSAPATEGSVLVVSENYFPGWSARSGSTSLPVSRANYNLIGVGLEAGTRQVELTFADPSYSTGKLVTLFALVAAVLLLVAGIVLDRRPRLTVAEAAA